VTLTDASVTPNLTGTVTVNVGAEAVATKYAIQLVSPTPIPVTPFPGMPPVTLGPQAPPSATWAPTVVAGTSVPINVVALDSQNDPVTTYDATANVTSTDPSANAIPNASVPATATFSGGSTTFDATFVTAGPQTITFTDQTNTSLTASQNVNVVNPVTPTKYVISLVPNATPGGPGMLDPAGPTAKSVPNVASGKPFAVAVAALDAQNRPAIGYDGTAIVSVSDTVTGVKYPATITFNNDGLATFNVTLVTGGPQTITVTGATSSGTTLTATLKVNVVVPGVATSYAIRLAPPTTTPPTTGGPTGFLPIAPIPTPLPIVVSGTQFGVAVTALDGLGQKATDYTGTADVVVSDTVTGTKYPGTVTFTSGGTVTFDVTLVSAGKQTITVTDENDPSLTATLTVYVIVPPTTKPGGGPRLG
jgi:hypothetical protein